MAITTPLSGVSGGLVIKTGANASEVVAALGAAGTTAPGFIRQWNADFRHDLTPNDTFENNDNFKQFIGGMYDCAGTCQGWADSVLAFNLANIIAPDFIAPATATISLVVRVGNTANMAYTFVTQLSNINMQVVKSSELSQYTLFFQSTGVISTTQFDDAP